MAMDIFLIDLNTNIQRNITDQEICIEQYNTLPNINNMQIEWIKTSISITMPSERLVASTDISNNLTI